MVWMTAAYVFSMGVGWGFWMLGQTSLPPLWNLLWADIGATLAIFAASLFFNNSSLYDPFWSITPMALVALALMSTGRTFNAVDWGILIGVWFWGGRLTYNFLRSWPGLRHEDWRYQNFRKSTGGLYWIVSLTGIHFFPTLLVFAGLGGALECILNAGDVNLFWALTGFTLCVVATLIEAISDNQLLAFNRAKKTGGGAIINEGLWRYSRHPNYFGEWLFWFGLGCLSYGGGASWWWVVGGPLAMLALFLLASIPMLDKRSLERRPGYAEHMKAVSGFMPLPPKQ